MTHPRQAWLGQHGMFAKKALAVGCFALGPCALAQAAAPPDATATVPDVSAPRQPNPASSDPASSLPAEQDAARSPLIVKLEVSLPDGCGTASEFRERLRSRLRGVRFSEQGATHALRAEVIGMPNLGYKGTMTLTLADGHAASRAVNASDCNDATEALALIAAVAIDPSNADLSPMPHSTREAPVVEERSAALAQRPKVVERPSAGRTNATSLVLPPKQVENQYLLGIGAAAAASNGLSPGWMTGVDLSFRLGQLRRNWFAPAARVGFGYSVDRSVAAPGGVADFRLLSMQLDLCGWQAKLAALEMRACGLVHTAILTAAGRATEAPQSRHRPVLGFGAALELVLLPHARWGLPVRFQAFIPTTRDVFAFDPYAFHRVAGAIFGATAGVEARFQ